MVAKFLYDNLVEWRAEVSKLLLMILYNQLKYFKLFTTKFEIKLNKTIKLYQFEANHC